MEKENYCENTDCKSKNEDVMLIRMLPEFGGDDVYWCEDCRERDWDMIDTECFNE